MAKIRGMAVVASSATVVTGTITQIGDELASNWWRHVLRAVLRSVGLAQYNAWLAERLSAAELAELRKEAGVGDGQSVPR